MISAYRLNDPFSPYKALFRHFAIVMQMAKRQVADRYRGSFIGLLWSFFNPLLLLIIYTFVFGFIFKSRWTGQTGGHVEFAMILFAGLNINAMFAECANAAPSLIVENTSFVKKVVFPLETLAWSTLGSALFHLAVSTLVLLGISLVVNHSIPWTAVLFPVIVLCFMPFVVGTVWLLASLGVFLRDMRQVIGIITTVLMFLAPIMYPRDIIPDPYRQWMLLNPLTIVVESSQDVLVWGRQPLWVELGIYLLCSIIFAWLSFVWFERSRKGFADVL